LGPRTRPGYVTEAERLSESESESMASLSSQAVDCVSRSRLALLAERDAVGTVFDVVGTVTSVDESWMELTQ